MGDEGRLKTAKNTGSKEILGNLRLREVDPLAGTKAEEAFEQRLKALHRKFEKKEKAPTGLRFVDELSVAIPSHSLTFGNIETAANRRLKEATAKIAAEQYLEALELLEILLRENPEQDEAHYLRGYCFLRLLRFEAALEALLVLARSEAPKRIQTRARSLRTEIRDAMLTSVVEEHESAMVAGNASRALERSARLTELDPDGAVHHYHFATALAAMGRAMDALSALDRALAREHLDERDVLSQLRVLIAAFAARNLLEPAREAYKKKMYRAARGLADAADPRIHSTPLWSSFQARVAQCEAGRAADPPPGPTEVQEELHAFLVQPEIVEGRTWGSMGRFRESRAAFERAAAHAPHYPFANFLIGAGLYTELRADFDAGNAPPLGDAITALERALRHATFGASDPEILQAPELVEGITDALTTLKTMRPEVEKLQTLGALFEAWHKEKPGGGLAGFTQSRSKLLGIQKRVAETRASLSIPQAIEALDELAGAITSVLGQLNELEPHLRDLEPLNPILEEFGTTMHALKTGTMLLPHPRLCAKLREMRQRANALRAQMKSPQAQKTAKEFDETLGTVLTALERGR